MDDLLEQFVIEGRELVLRASEDLLALEEQPDDLAAIDSAFRSVHTLKGSVGLFDFAPFAAMLRAAEDLLGAVRDGDLALDESVVGYLFGCINQTERWLDAIASTGRLPADAEDEGGTLTTALSAALARSAPDASPRADTSLSANDDWIDRLLARSATLPVGDAGVLVAIHYTPDPDCFFRGDDPVAIVKKTPGLAGLRISSREPWESGPNYDPFTCNLVIDALSTAPKTEVATAYRFVADQVRIVEISRRSATSPPAAALEFPGRTLRIDPLRIDALADIVDELIIAKNGLSQLAAEAESGAMGQALALSIRDSQTRIGRLLTGLHNAVTNVRLVSLNTVLRRLPRMARDIAGKLGKNVDFFLQCDDVEADKSIADGLFEPLLHIVRNAIDHGVEAPARRVEVGKPARGAVRLSVWRAGDQIIIEVIDDGQGIDTARIREVARERSIMPKEAIDALSDEEAIDFVFAPGFSTAAAVSDISGRGVGMDAVRAAVNRLGGRVSVDSAPGKGTTVRLTLPLVLVMTQVTVVASGGQRFGVPMDAVVEIARVASDRIVPIREGRAFVLRDRVVPLFNLADLLGQDAAPRVGGDIKVLIVRTADDVAGVAVDQFVDRMDILLRPMKGLLAGMRGIAGTTLLGEGSVLMVLDLPGLIG